MLWFQAHRNYSPNLSISLTKPFTKKKQLGRHFMADNWQYYNSIDIYFGVKQRQRIETGIQSAEAENKRNKLRKELKRDIVSVLWGNSMNTPHYIHFVNVANSQTLTQPAWVFLRLSGIRFFICLLSSSNFRSVRKSLVIWLD